MSEHRSFCRSALPAAIAAAWLGIATSLAPGGEAASAPEELALVPWPASVQCSGERLSLGADARIAARTPALVPLAKVVSGELEALSGRRLAEDGSWTKLGKLDSARVKAALPSGTVKALRLRAESPQRYWLIVREIVFRP